MKLLRVPVLLICVLILTLGVVGSAAAGEKVTRVTGYALSDTLTILDYGTCTPTGAIYQCEGFKSTFRQVADDPRLVGWSTQWAVRDVYNPVTGSDPMRWEWEFVSDEGGTWRGQGNSLPYAFSPSEPPHADNHVTAVGEGLYAGMKLRLDFTNDGYGNATFTAKIIEP